MIPVRVEGGSMAIHVSVDDRLLESAMRLGAHSTKRETVHQALREYVERRQRIAAKDAFGTFDFDSAYDYKEARRKR